MNAVARGSSRTTLVMILIGASFAFAAPSRAASTADGVGGFMWTSAKSKTAHGRAFQTASLTGASATFNVRGKRFAMWYVAGPSNGKVAVLVNGKRVRTLDQYAPRASRRAVSLTGTKAVNQVQVVVLSTKNRRSKGTKVNVDAFSPTTRSCARGCTRNPKPKTQQAASVPTTPVTTPSGGPLQSVIPASAGEAVWYPTTVPSRASAEWTVAIGSYVRSRDVKPVDTAVPVIRAAACDQARKVPRGIVILSFGRQVRGGTSGFTASSPLSHNEIVATTAAWAAGLAECGTGPWEVSIGTSNSGAVTRYNGFSGGATWARLVTRARAASDPRVSVTGSVDLEPGWGPPGQARAWVDGYVATTPIRLWNFGSADGCPQTYLSKLTCNNGWTIDDVLWVSSHAGPNVVAMPQIHTQSGSQARQWAVMAARGIAMSKPLRLAAITVQTAACSQVKGGCPKTGVSAWDGWTQVRSAIDAIPIAAGTPVGAPMDIRWGWANGFVIPKPTTTTTSTSSTTTTSTTTTTTTVPTSTTTTSTTSTTTTASTTTTTIAVTTTTAAVTTTSSP